MQNHVPLENLVVKQLRDNAVALDTVVARPMVVDPARLVFLKKAKDFGLGEFD